MGRSRRRFRFQLPRAREDGEKEKRTEEVEGKGGPLTIILLILSITGSWDVLRTGQGTKKAVSAVGGASK